MICEKCGADMKEIQGAFSEGMECPNCGWGWVTTNIGSIADDNTDYEIWLQPGNTGNTSNIKLVADIANVNFVQAKQLLDSNCATMIYKAVSESATTMPKAQRVQIIAKRLKETEISFSISPDFPYDV
ncbi:MAG: zf-TFIIB domain-containing protein [Firmicutes bacterium]|nr:zf-TFIIB domain-containing protein [Bacillota bacterium]